jgi:hypothetical protein
MRWWLTVPKSNFNVEEDCEQFAGQRAAVACNCYAPSATVHVLRRADSNSSRNMESASSLSKHRQMGRGVCDSMLAFGDHMIT